MVHYAILSYGFPKSTQVHLVKNEFSSSQPFHHLPHLQVCLSRVLFRVVHCSLVHITFSFWCTILIPAIFTFKKGANFSSAAGLCFPPPFLNSHVLRTLTANAEQAPASHSCSHSRPRHQRSQSPTLGSARSLSLRPRSPRHRHFAAYTTCCFLIIILSTIIYIFINCVFCFVLHNRYGLSSSSLASVPLIPTAVAGLPTPAATLPLTPASLPEFCREPLRVIVSASLPPVPGKVKEKIKQGLYVDLRELMPDNAALSKMLSEVGAVSAVQAGSKVLEIEDPLTWAFYFLALLPCQ